MANYTTVYYYEFGYQGNVTNSNRTYEGLYVNIIWQVQRIYNYFIGVGHGEDIYYLFHYDSLNYTETDLKVSDTIVALWSNFAKFG